jgi:cyclopropane fatty-acyl-phospholipid synthase-like methyltransferase
VEGEIGVEGRLADVIDVAATLAAHGKDPHRHGPRMIRHNRKIDAEAIAYHYDVSNEFYASWLDPNMVYSCGYFRSPEDTLETAQIQKIDHILAKLRIRPGDRLLDIGCGWGALVLRAAEKYGAKVLGITLSRNQYELARERIAAAGLTDRCEVRLEDYRDVAGKFDRITSVGMFEHVGLKNLRGYFARLHELLADNGAVLNHGITSTDPDSAESPFRGGDFIERYVFPPRRAASHRAGAEGNVCDRPGASGRGKSASPLCADPHPLGRTLRGGRRETQGHRRRKTLAHLAGLPGGLRPRFRARLDVPPPGPGRQVRSQYAAIDTRLHVWRMKGAVASRPPVRL